MQRIVTTDKVIELSVVSRFLRPSLYLVALVPSTGVCSGWDHYVLKRALITSEHCEYPLRGHSTFLMALEVAKKGLIIVATGLQRGASALKGGACVCRSAI